MQSYGVDQSQEPVVEPCISASLPDEVALEVAQAAPAMKAGGGLYRCIYRCIYRYVYRYIMSFLVVWLPSRYKPSFLELKS